ncbi:hypothetical protein K501DRAFT_337296 [Backusella circina FSU 941]|nr:hypothetical protein K501DRAFT_337296 [Backusella circina FSU 941]
MANNFCSALLETSTIQLLQAAGFESSQSSATHVLTNVFEDYICLLASTVSAYSRLSGRTAGNVWDVMDGFEELAIDLDDLKNWLSTESKSLTPSWTEQGDPSRILEGIIQRGKDTNEDNVLYEYGKQPEKTPVGSEVEEDEDEEDDEEEVNSPVDHHLPDYIPKYFPAFPIISTEEIEPAVVESKVPLAVTDSTLPLPNIVKKKKHPIDNPFTHLTPFEDSMLATDKEQPEALSLALDSSKERVHITPRRRRRSETLNQIVNEMEREGPKRKHIKDSTHILSEFTQNDAAPGNNMFTDEPGLLEKLMMDLSPQVAISKLTTPNLLTDIMIPPGASSSGGSSLRLKTQKPGAPSQPPPPPPAPQQGQRKQSLGGITIDESSNKPIVHLRTSVSTPPKEPTHHLSPTTLPLSPKTEKVHTEPPHSDVPVSLAAYSSSPKNHPMSPTSPSLKPPKKKLTISLPKLDPKLNNNTTSTPNSAHTSPAQTPKITFKIKLPIEKTTSEPTDIIKCICDNPTIDYGAFMIACDLCGVWFHGNCVGVAEHDQVEEWYCRRCKNKKIKNM